MELFRNSDWIWLDGCTEDNIYLDFSAELVCETGKKYFMNISADSYYALYLNGEYCRSSQYADFPFCKAYDSFDITDKLVIGKNKLLITVYYQGKDTFTYRRGDPGLIFEVTADNEVVLSSGRDIFARKNPFFKSGEAELVSPQLGFTFNYDSTVNDGNCKWSFASVTAKNVNFTPCPIEPLTIREPNEVILTVSGSFCENGGQNAAQRMQHAYMSFSDSTKKLLPSDDGIVLSSEKDSDGIYAVIDLKRETVGYIYLDLYLERDCDIIIGHGEHLDDLRVRAEIGNRCFANVYRAKRGHNIFFDPFLRLGLRYMQLNIYSDSAKLFYAGVRETVYPLSDRPYFKSSDRLHNKIYDVSRRTLELCMHVHYEDCPWREQALYAMDSRNQMLCGYYVFGEFKFARASLLLLGSSIRDDDMLEICSPARHNRTIPSFTAIYVVSLYEYLIHSGDVEFIREMLPVVRRICDKLSSHVEPNGLMKPFDTEKYWNFYEWQEGLSDVGGDCYDCLITLFCSMAISSFGKMLNIIGEDGADKYLSLSKRMNESADRNFFDEEMNGYASYIDLQSGKRYHYAALTSALMVCSGAATGERFDKALDTLSSDRFYPVTLSHSIYKFDALMKDASKYSEYVWNEIADVWGDMLFNGATSFYETVDGADAFYNAGSLCHGWSAVPAYIYFRYGAGYRVSDDGEVKYTFEPHSSCLGNCRARIVTPHGEIEV